MTAATIERPSRTVLLVETDRYTLNQLPRILSDRLPQVTIDICSSAEQLSRILPNASYDTVAVCPVLMGDYRVVQHRISQHLLVPMIVTAGRDDLPIAETALKDEAFDLITKPIVPHEAVNTVRLALWHSQLLRLLASKERAVSRFHEHMRLFPHAVRMEQEFAGKMAAYERTIRAVSASMQRLLNADEEESAFDIAVLLAHLMKQQALNRLFHLYEEGPSQ